MPHRRPRPAKAVTPPSPTRAFDVEFSVVAIGASAGGSRPGDLGFSVGAGDGVRSASRPEQRAGSQRQTGLAELCRRMILDAYAPAAVLINARNECLFSLALLIHAYAKNGLTDVA
jgi:hypothetical protein